MPPNVQLSPRNPNIRAHSFVRQHISPLNSHLPIRLILALKPQPNHPLLILPFPRLPLRDPDPAPHNLSLVKRRGAGVQREHVLADLEAAEREVDVAGVAGRGDGDEVVYRGAVGERGRRRVRVCVDDLVAALLAFADYGGYAAEDAFAFGGALGWAVEDFCAGGEAGARVWGC